MEIINMYATPDSSEGEKPVEIPVEDPQETLSKMLEINLKNIASVSSKVAEKNSFKNDSDFVKIKKNILSQYPLVWY